MEANKDQTGRAFIQDVVMSMFDEGVVAIVPVDTIVDQQYLMAIRFYHLELVKLRNGFQITFELKFTTIIVV